MVNPTITTIKVIENLKGLSQSEKLGVIYITLLQMENTYKQSTIKLLQSMIEDKEQTEKFKSKVKDLLCYAEMISK